MMLYHRLTGFPHELSLSLPQGNIWLTYSNHAREEARRDRYGDFSKLLPEQVDVNQARLIEAETDAAGDVIKAMYRIALDECRDLCLVMTPGRAPYKWDVRTVWVNRPGDRHQTINLRRYRRVLPHERMAMAG